MIARDDAIDRSRLPSLDRLAGAAAALLDVPLVVISVLAGARQEIVGAYALVEQRAEREACALCRDVALSGKPIVVQDANSRLLPAARRGWGVELVAYAGMPVILDGGRAGALAVFAPARRTWQSRELLVLRSLADAAGAILDMRARCDQLRTQADDERAATKQRLARLAARVTDVEVETAERERVTSHTHRRITAELEQTSVHDELTGLLNRRGLFAIGEAQLEMMRRDAGFGLLMYIDIDGLKTTNDRAGHAAGDDLLCAAASVLLRAFRDEDTIARLGGDEFVVLVTNAQPRDPSAMAARLASELRRCNDLRDPQLALAWSLGLVAIEPTTECHLDAVMAEADRRMYAAKRARRGAQIATPACRTIDDRIA